MKLLRFSFCQLFLLLFSSSCIAQVQYFINCGSSANATISSTGQTFVGDDRRDIVGISGHGSKAVIDTDQSESLYKTARVFKKPSSYDFDIPQVGTYFVRLHFCAFSSLLADAKFNVSASTHMLLPDFSLARKNATDCATNTKEFLLTIPKEKFRIYFVPSSSSSIAFVNAIEILNTLSNITEDTGPHVSPAGSLGDYKGQKSKVLETFYRINVGGEEVEASSDILWRTWMPDDQYLINKGDAQNAPDMSSSINYAVGQATRDDAPSDVYGTAKILKNQNNSTIPILTWQFNVNKGSQYFVRLHFCDIIAVAAGDYYFTVYIYRKFNQVLYPTDIAGSDTPFYKDYIVESDDLGFMNISVGPNNASSNRNYLFLNGLEIMQVKDGTAVVPRVDDSRSHLVLVVSIVASAVALIGVLAAFVLVLLHKKKRKKPGKEPEWDILPLHGAASSHNRNSGSASSYASTFQNLQLGLKIPFVEIQRVTNNFDTSLIIGQGGFGKVYKGTLRSGLKVAVKRGSPDHGQGIAEFQTEIMILSKIRHRHLVSLIGYCYDNGEMILVYEFMEKGTLRYHLYDENGSASSNKGMLSWTQRLEICIGAAKGILYLHTATNRGIIHRDVKSTNILLDENYVAKVADFGLSRSGYLEESHVSISGVKGTIGYLDPEYIICLQLTEKSDVYAFGVVLLEVLCARPVIDLSLPKEQLNLADWAMACYEMGQLETIIDPMIAGEIKPNSLKKFYETAERCLNKDGAERPPMSDVCWSLEYTLQLQKAAAEGVLLDDTTADASLTMPLRAVRRLPSQSIVDYDYNDESFNTGTGEVFSQLTFDDHAAGR